MHRLATAWRVETPHRTNHSSEPSGLASRRKFYSTTAAWRSSPSTAASRVWILRQSDDGTSRGFATAVFENTRRARTAIATLHETELTAVFAPGAKRR